MSRSAKVVIGCGAVSIVLLMAAVVVAFVLTRRTSEVISEATSPDKSWSISVLAQPVIGGSYEIVVQVRETDGSIVTSSVRGLESDLDAARQAFRVQFTDNDQAQLGNRDIVEKPRHFP